MNAEQLAEPETAARDMITITDIALAALNGETNPQTAIETILIIARRAYDRIN